MLEVGRGLDRAKRSRRDRLIAFLGDQYVFCCLKFNSSTLFSLSTTDNRVDMASHKDIGQALEALYTFMVRIGYVEHEDLNWSPHDPPLPLDICRKVGLSRSAISLIDTIPWPRHATFTGEIAADTFLVDWSRTDMVEGSRHPDHFWLDPADEAGPYIVAHNQVAITWFAEGNRGVLWLIDADKGANSFASSI